jgi:hypothetical protein
LELQGFTAIQQAGKSLHLQKQILLNLPGISNLCKSTLELGWLYTIPAGTAVLIWYYQVGIWKRAHIAKPVYLEPTHDNGWQCVDGMIESKWVSGETEIWKYWVYHVICPVTSFNSLFKQIIWTSSKRD